MPVKPTAFAIRPAVFEELGGFDMAWRVSQDWELMLRYARRYPIGFLPERLAILRHSGDSLHLEAGAPQESLALVRGELRRIDRADREALRSARACLALAAKHVAWEHQRDGHRIRAAATLLAGGLRSRDAGLLARAAAACLPSSATRVARTTQSARRAKPA